MTRLGEDGRPAPPISTGSDNKYHYDKLIRMLVDEGFGSYRECAEADIVDAAIFIYLKNDPAKIAEQWMNS